MEEADLPRVGEVGPAADLVADRGLVADLALPAYLTLPAYLNRPDGVGVALAEEGERTGSRGVAVRLLALEQRQVVADGLVHRALDRGELGGGDGGDVGEVEAQAVGGHERPGLAHVRAEHVAQDRVQQVGRGVVAGDVEAPVGIDRGADRIADAQSAVRDGREVRDDLAGGLLCVPDARGA